MELSDFLRSLSWIARHYEQSTDSESSDIYGWCDCFQNEV
jgi:hypothetical protein